MDLLATPVHKPIVGRAGFAGFTLGMLAGRALLEFDALLAHSRGAKRAWGGYNDWRGRCYLALALRGASDSQPGTG